MRTTAERCRFLCALYGQSAIFDQNVSTPYKFAINRIGMRFDAKCNSQETAISDKLCRFRSKLLENVYFQ